MYVIKLIDPIMTCVCPTYYIAGKSVLLISISLLDFETCRTTLRIFNDKISNYGSSKVGIKSPQALGFIIDHFYLFHNKVKSYIFLQQPCDFNTHKLFICNNFNESEKKKFAYFILLR